MSIVRQEALETRAKALYTIPVEIGAGEYAGLTGPCPDFYDGPTDGRYHLKMAVHELSSEQRFALLACLVPHNGLRMVRVELDSGTARLELHFFNRNFFGEIISEISDDPSALGLIFRISGGLRIPAGDAIGQVHATEVEDRDDAQAVLILTVNPIGDYSTYTLAIDTQPLPPSVSIDPLFGEIDFKFRPGCFSTDCAPEWLPAPPPKDEPAIDYLAKDYASFKHTLIAAMGRRVPGWRATSEADLDQVLLELFSAAADELSDYQDRVMNEAYLGSARKRVSLARHARLMDYHIHQGNQASTWLALLLGDGMTLTVSESAPLIVWAGSELATDAPAVVFSSRTGTIDQPLHHLLNRLGLYTWDGVVPALAAGTTSADLQSLYPDGTSRNDHDSAEELQNLLRSDGVRHLLIQERLNPTTGGAAGRDPRKRQLLRLLSGDTCAEILEDPVTGQSFVRVHWEAQDALQADYCFSVDCEEGIRNNVSLFHGNLLPVYHGRFARTVFKDPQALLAEGEQHYRPTDRWGTLCPLPEGPLAYRTTPPGGDVPPRSTLSVTVVTATTDDPWEESINLIHSDAGAESGDHFMVETDENGRSQLRFGNGINGRALPEDCEVHCEYQVGHGLDGNIGADSLIYFDHAGADGIASCWNPFDITDGCAPEPVAEIIRRAPEAYRARQLRAVTLQDYIDRAQELPGVARAAARYAWTGSWRCVRIAIDPVGTTEFNPALRQQVGRHLEAVRLIGEDLEIRPPRFVPLDIRIVVCIRADYWIEDIRFLIQQELSEGYTPDGRKGFFHPDRWSFGQLLRASEIIGRIQRIEGVDHVASLTMKRWNASTPGGQEIAEVRANEIIRVRNDPDHMEDGFITLDVHGGRA